jgi:hypothetical protein
VQCCRNVLEPTESPGGQQANEGREVIVSHALVFGTGQTTAQGLEQGKLSVTRVDSPLFAPIRC